MIRAIKDQPALSLENPMNCTKCLVGDQISMIFRCKNNGGDAHFKFLSQDINNANINNNAITTPMSHSAGMNTSQHNPESEVLTVTIIDYIDITLLNCPTRVLSLQRNGNRHIC